jgi:hypothetical protein
VPDIRKIREDFECHWAAHDFVNHPRQQSRRLAISLTSTNAPSRSMARTCHAKCKEPHLRSIFAPTRNSRSSYFTGHVSADQKAREVEPARDPVYASSPYDALGGGMAQP